MIVMTGINCKENIMNLNNVLLNIKQANTLLLISLILIFSDSATDEDDGEGETELLDSDEDEIDENGAQYLEKLESRIHSKSNGTINIEVLQQVQVRIINMFHRMKFKNI